MNNVGAWRAAAAAVLLAAGSCVSPVKTSSRPDAARAAADRRALAVAVVGQWSNASSLAARRLIEQYGVPDEVRYSRLIWNHNGPWKRTVVRDVRPAYVEGDDLGIVEQTVDYALVPGREGALTAFDDRVAYNARIAELSARSDREELNFLRLNLFDDVVHGRQGAHQARQSYEALVRLEASGKTSPYMTGLHLAGAP